MVWSSEFHYLLNNYLYLLNRLSANDKYLLSTFKNSVTLAISKMGTLTCIKKSYLFYYYFFRDVKSKHLPDKVASINYVDMQREREISQMSTILHNVWGGGQKSTKSCQFLTPPPCYWLLQNKIYVMSTWFMDVPLGKINRLNSWK